MLDQSTPGTGRDRRLDSSLTAFGEDFADTRLQNRRRGHLRLKSESQSPLDIRRNVDIGEEPPNHARQGIHPASAAFVRKRFRHIKADLRPRLLPSTLEEDFRVKQKPVLIEYRPLELHVHIIPNSAESSVITSRFQPHPPPRRRAPRPPGEKEKKPAASYSRTGESRTTLGDGALDFRVRNGNGYGSSSMATGKKPLKLGTKENYNPCETRGGRSHVRGEVKEIAKPHAMLVPVG